MVGTSRSPVEDGVDDFPGDELGSPIFDVKGVELGIGTGRISGEGEGDAAGLAPRGGGGGGGLFAPYFRSEEEDADLK